MDSERQHWLVRVLEAAERAADQVDGTGSLYHRGLHADLLALQERLRGELNAPEHDVS